MQKEDTQTSYIFDANCFIDAWNNYYSPDMFKSYWDDMLLGKIQDNTIILQEEIFDEINKKDPKMKDWIKKNNIVGINTDIIITKKVQEINSNFINLIKESKGKSLADPFIIAYASLYGGTVVTQEKKTGNESSPKIPDVCDKMNVRCINLFDFLKEEKVSFVYSPTN